MLQDDDDELFYDICFMIFEQDVAGTPLSLKQTGDFYRGVMP
jgi:hypothetical protein